MKNIPDTFPGSHYEKLLVSLDAICRGLDVYYGAEISCRERCTSCCISGISVFPVEAWFIRNSMDPSFIPSTGTGSCVFLKDGICSVYGARPVLCRTQGYPLLYRGEPGDECHLELSACELNFTGTKEFSVDHVINMEKVNTSLAAVNIRFLHDSGLFEEYVNRRFLMEEIPSLEW